MPGRNGGTLKVGNPGHDGSNAGRKPDAFKAYLEAALESPECQLIYESILKHGGRHDAKVYLQAVALAAQFTKSKPAEAQEIRHSGEIGLVPVPPDYDVAQWAKLCSGGRN